MVEVRIDDRATPIHSFKRRMRETEEKPPPRDGLHAEGVEGVADALSGGGRREVPVARGGRTRRRTCTSPAGDVFPSVDGLQRPSVMVVPVCTGIGAPHCPDEQLAWQLYDEHGYRPRELRPCLTASRPVVTDGGRHRSPRNRLVRLLLRQSRRPQ